MKSERRHFIRPETLNLLDYLCIDKEGLQGDYAMGRTLNVSEGGILMETHLALETGCQVMITLGLEDRLIDVMGKIVHSEHEGGRHQIGVEFFHISDDDKKILNKYVKVFHENFPEAHKTDPLHE